MSVVDYKEHVREYHARNLDKLAHIGGLGFIKLDLLRQHSAGDAPILSAGCGTGTLEMAVAREAGHVHGCDLTIEALRRYRESAAAAKLSRLTQVNGDLARLPYRSDRFALLYSFSTLYYIREIDSVLTEFHRVLGRGGTVVLEFANSLSINAVHSRLRYACPHFFLSPWRMDRALARAGFSVVARRHFYLFPTFLSRGPLKSLLSMTIGGRSLDERLSSLPVVRNLACKILVVATKTPPTVAPTQ